MRNVASFLFFIFTTFSVSAQVSFGDAYLFNDGWEFVLADDSLAFTSHRSDYDVRTLNLPHDWSVEQEASSKFASCQGYLPTGIGWYRKTFDLKELDVKPDRLKYSQDCSYIYFEGIYCRSSVYLNGHLLGYRPNGYVSFFYDLSSYLQEGRNELLVKVDHHKQADSRWYTGSGIYRNVWMVKANRNHFTPWGTSYVCTSLSDEEATIVVESSYVGRVEKRAVIRVELRDAKGKVVATGEIAPRVPGYKARTTLTVKNPERWDINHPYLYTLTAKLIINFSESDHTEMKVGLRSLDFDANTGFALNGRNIKVKGVCLHHDAGVLGAAVPKEVWRRRLVNLKAMGANAIRMSHNPQAPEVYDLCDELGLLVMDEVSDEWEFPKRKWVEGWNKGTPAYEGTFDFFEEWIERDVTDMVMRDRNHPCVFLWSIGNEVDYPNDPYSHPVLDGKESGISQPMYGGYKPEQPNAERIGKIAKRLAACVRAVDTSRPVTGALAGVVMSNETEYPAAIDVTGYNYTESRYITDHELYPARIIYGSETGVGYDSWKAVRDNDHIFGQFVWTGFDYLGESGAWPSRGLGTGLIDFCGNLKPRGKFRAALWAEEPVCYLGTYPLRGRFNNMQPSIEAPAFWNYNEVSRVRVCCYTNASSARLLLNGVVVGERREKDDATGIIYWDIDYNPGQLVCEAYNGDEMVASNLLQTSGEPARLEATLLNPERKPGEVAQILVRVVDKNGVLCRGNYCITANASGKNADFLLRLESGNNSDMSRYTSNSRNTYQGELLCYLRGTKKVTFHCDGLSDLTIKVKK